MRVVRVYLAPQALWLVVMAVLAKHLLFLVLLFLTLAVVEAVQMAGQPEQVEQVAAATVTLQEQALMEQ